MSCNKKSLISLKDIEILDVVEDDPRHQLRIKRLRRLRSHLKYDTHPSPFITDPRQMELLSKGYEGKISYYFIYFFYSQN